MLHIVGSIIFIGFMVTALVSFVVRRGNRRLLRFGAVAIGGHQVVTGLLLGLLSPSMTMLAVCARGLLLVSALYVVIWAVEHRLAPAVVRAD